MLGQGSTFTLYMPVHAAPAAGSPTAEPTVTADLPALPPTADLSKPRRMLVVEAHADGLLTLIARGAATTLADTHGLIDVVTAVDPDTAIAELRSQTFHLVVLDLAMPADQGPAFLKALHEQARMRELPVLVYRTQLGSLGNDTLLQAFAQTRPLESLSSLDDLRERITLYMSTDAGSPVMPPTTPIDTVAQLAHAAGDLAGRKVLVVDDDARNVFALTNILELHGMEVVYAENGRKGIEVLAQHDDVDLILMDVMMPEMDGYAATAAIRAMPKYARLPIIAVTAKAMHGDREKSLSSGASDYVTKPVDAEDLLACIERWLAQDLERTVTGSTN